MAAADPDGDGQSNFFEFFADLLPTNAMARFTLQIAASPDRPGAQYLLFSPRRTDRRYTVEFSTDVSAAFTPLTNATEIDFGATRFVIDPDADVPNKFYRVKISLP